MAERGVGPLEVGVRGMEGNPQALHRLSCSRASSVGGGTSLAPEDVTLGGVLLLEGVVCVIEETVLEEEGGWGLGFCLCLLLSLLLSSTVVDDDADDDDATASTVPAVVATPPYLKYTPPPSLPGLRGMPLLANAPPARPVTTEEEEVLVVVVVIKQNKVSGKEV